eukprot:356113-Chlamydomonas_euryale.AAC.5
MAMQHAERTTARGSSWRCMAARDGAWQLMALTAAPRLAGATSSSRHEYAGCANMAATSRPAVAPTHRAPRRIARRGGRRERSRGRRPADWGRDTARRTEVRRGRSRGSFAPPGRRAATRLLPQPAP